jgi:protein-disulfide isomerase
MSECRFCEEEFDNKTDLHIHWGEEHEDELNSHQKEKVKKAKREKKEEREKKNAKRKQMAGMGLAGIGALAVIALLGSQLISTGPTGQEIPLEGQPMIGNDDANVTVVEFGDYRCPVCKQFHDQTWPQLKDNYIDTGKIKFYFVNYAFLDQNFAGETSTRAAVAGECVLNQDEEQFWNFHSALYENQGAERQDWATQDFLMELARENTEGLDYNQLQTCVDNRQTSEKVQQDRSIGRNAGVTGTPSVYVNGNKIENWQYSGLRAAIEQQLRK